MISVITLTYKRHHLLEEAIESFLRQDADDCEMIIINDAEDVKYTYDGNDTRIKIINVATRFKSITSKLKYAFSFAKNEHMFRLDDDDLLAENSLRDAKKAIISNPGYDIYRSKSHYYFLNNKYDDISGSVNNGNIYTKKYISRLQWVDLSIGEDGWLTFSNDGKIYTYPEISMIYRWGMSTYHISGLGDIEQEEMFKHVKKVSKEKGSYNLQPKFLSNYYEQIQLKS